MPENIASQNTHPIPVSILDLAMVPQGATPREALHRSLDLARHAEGWGYRRFWVAEHHNMIGVASAATSVVIGYIAGGTETIRVGSGGIMLPNHAPLVIAEQFGTLDALYPGRIDIGLGRAPGTDPRTTRALRRDPARADEFPQDVRELQAYLGPLQPGQTVQAIPGTDSHIPLWLLGSSLFGAQLAGVMGLPYAFASHFAPDALLPALRFYRDAFQPSEQCARPYAMPTINVIAADDDAAARHLFTSAQQSFTNIFRGTRGMLPPPIDDMDTYWTPDQKEEVDRMLARSLVGSPETIRRGLVAFIAETGADELMIAAPIFDHAARLRSYEIIAEITSR
jgi:luciferase family oxidoreductase group 1